MHGHYRIKVVPYDDDMTYSVPVLTVSMVTSMCNIHLFRVLINIVGSHGNLNSPGFKYKIYNPILWRHTCKSSNMDFQPLHKIYCSKYLRDQS